MSVDRKKQILEAATKSFAQFGYKGTTMDLVSKLANVGKGTIYTFYKNKEDLFSEIIDHLLLDMKIVADEAFDSQRPFVDSVHQALYSILEFRKTHHLTIKIFQESQEMGTPTVNEGVQKVEEMVLQYIKQKIIDAIDRNELKQCDPELTAFIILKLYISLIFDWEKHHEPLEKGKIAEIFEGYLLKGLSIR
ncbi:TetR/AcrR family transcriptional regulator [Metabacillus halosaccharovorans]|uniref:TetR/AcrR family transcriptional regulator n=1 Tax=Metabacillus halosaccharovorans TaxID=930124 RepID=A0ABT3DJB5_9BACI|nr:TetR/AcrR family transcriptional regulator [Metabacillus halosaccharovorans]MCV9887148.1 TetR/AcrR family transcriptional regulator [Metabacillus halosaccharovorans]